MQQQVTTRKAVPDQFSALGAIGVISHYCNRGYREGSVAALPRERQLHFLGTMLAAIRWTDMRNQT